MQPTHVKIYPLDQDVTKTWFVQFKDPKSGKIRKKYGNFSQLSTVKEKLREAARIIRGLDLKAIEQKPKKNFPYPGHDVPRLIEMEFQERCIYLRTKSVSTYHTKVKEFVIWYRQNAFKPNVLSAGVGIAFLKHLKESNRSHTTINAYRNTLKSIFSGLKAQIPINPFEDTHKLKERRKSYWYFDEETQEELSKIIFEEDPELWMACQCQYYLLLRPNELRTIKIGAFNLRGANVRIEGDISKNGKTQSITIPDEFIKKLDFIYDYPPHFYLFGKGGGPGMIPHTKKYFPDHHQKLLKRHKFDTRVYKFYSWKHTGAVSYYLATGDVKGLKEQGRWHSLDMVNEYLKNLGILDIDRVKVNFPKIGNQAFQPGSGVSKELGL